ncbi:MAG: recombinase family protein [Streptosporangiaceae bacterium]
MGSTQAATPPQLTTVAPLVPVAFTGRTSTFGLQDPVASLRRQARKCQDRLPAGFVIVAWFWDVESGGLDIEQRGQSDSWQNFDVGIPRDGGLADLLREAASPSPRFTAVICEDIERSGRDTFNALRLEKELSRQGIPLFATDEPISIDGMNSTSVLVRRVKQGVAEWFRLQVKEKAWEGLTQHALDGWNIGPAPYGYAPDRVPHPVPVKAAQGRTKTRLALDPDRAPVVAQIFTWRTGQHLGTYAIARRLAADPGTYPAPDPAIGWTPQAVWKILANPKYTGHMVYGRRRKINGRTRAQPPAQWIWSPQPVHPAIVTRKIWDAAQAEGHATSPDDRGPTAPGRRTYVLRSRVRCRACNRRMYGATRPAAGGQVTWYLCPHSPVNPRHAAKTPDHPRAVLAREDKLLAAIAQFCHERVLGPDRAALLAADTPATAAADQARKNRETARLTKRLKMIDAFEDAHTTELEALIITAGAAPAVLTALRTRHINRFTELETERADITTRLAALTAPADDDPGDPALLDQLPVLPGLLDNAPERLIQQLLAAFDIHAIYHKKDDQITIRATITTTTPAAVLAIIADADALTAKTTRTDDHTSDLLARPMTRTIRTAPGVRGWCDRWGRRRVGKTRRITGRVRAGRHGAGPAWGWAGMGLGRHRSGPARAGPVRAGPSRAGPAWG